MESQMEKKLEPVMGAGYVFIISIYHIYIYIRLIRRDYVM